MSILEKSELEIPEVINPIMETLLASKSNIDLLSTEWLDALESERTKKFDFGLAHNLFQKTFKLRGINYINTSDINAILEDDLVDDSIKRKLESFERFANHDITHTLSYLPFDPNIATWEEFEIRTEQTINMAYMYTDLFLEFLSDMFGFKNQEKLHFTKTDPEKDIRPMVDSQIHRFAFDDSGCKKLTGHPHAEINYTNTLSPETEINIPPQIFLQIVVNLIKNPAKLAGGKGNKAYIDRLRAYRAEIGKVEQPIKINLKIEDLHNGYFFLTAFDDMCGIDVNSIIDSIRKVLLNQEDPYQYLEEQILSSEGQRALKNMIDNKPFTFDLFLKHIPEYLSLQHVSGKIHEDLHTTSGMGLFAMKQLLKKYKAAMITGQGLHNLGFITGILIPKNKMATIYPYPEIVKTRVKQTYQFPQAA